MTKKKRPNACRGHLYGGSEAGLPPPISSERKLSVDDGPLGKPGGPASYLGLWAKGLRSWAVSEGNHLRDEVAWNRVDSAAENAHLGSLSLKPRDLCQPVPESRR